MRCYCVQKKCVAKQREGSDATRFAKSTVLHLTSVALARKKRELVLDRIHSVYFYANIFVLFVIIDILAIGTSYGALTNYPHISPQPLLSVFSLLIDETKRQFHQRSGIWLHNVVLYAPRWTVSWTWAVTSQRSHAQPFLHPQLVHSCQQKSIGLKFSRSQTGNDVRYSCHHNSSRFTFPIFALSCRFSVLHSLQSITPRIY